MKDKGYSTPESEINARIKKLQARLNARDIEAALIMQNMDLYYFAGTIQQGQLFVPAEGNPVLMVRKDFERARAESPLRDIVRMNSPRQIPGVLNQAGCKSPKTLGLEMDVLPVNHFFNIQKVFKEARCVDVSHHIRVVRSVKSDYEIGLIQEAARLSDQVTACVPDLVREGMSEIELAGAVEAEARKRGHQGLVRMRLWGAEVFYGHLMAGPAAAAPSYLASPTGGAGVNAAVAQGSSFRPIGRHEPILVDYTFACNGYISDHTRIFSIGPLPESLAKAYAAMLDVQDVIKRSARPGVKASDIYQAAADRARELGVEENFMGAGPRRIRFVGHGVGLELDEYPFLAEGQEMVLEKGMVIAAEPKAIFPGVGVVGIENTHLVTDAGLTQLNRFPEDIQVIGA